MSEFLTVLQRHEGTWCGEYQVFDLAGQLLERYDSHVRCEFPPAGSEFAYVQHNEFVWADGRREQSSFGGVLDGERIVWDTDRFSGYAWATDGGVILLRLDRKDIADTWFVESILLEPGHDQRMRTWHWFERGEPIKRTLCNERRLPAQADA